MVRGTFETSLEELNTNILEMGEMVENALELAISGFSEDNISKLDTVIKEDIKINQYEININEKVTLMIAKQQPVAKDLRKVIVALKISSDLERVGDLAVDIAKVSKRLSDKDKQFEVKKKELLAIAKVAQHMITDALDAYQEKDVLKSQKIAHQDDSVDKEYGTFIRELFKANTHPTSAEQITNLAFIGRYIERIADYATNLAEWVVYEANGQYFDLN